MASRKFTARDKHLMKTRWVVSVLLFLPAIFIVLDGNYSASEVHWAQGLITALIGYWFR